MFEDLFPQNKMYKDLYYISKGREQCKSNHSFGPIIRGHFIVHVVLKGKGIFQTKESTYELAQGQFFVIYPNELTYYEADSEEPWEYLWFGFNGDVVEEIFKTIDITPINPVGTISNYENDINRLNTIVEKNLNQISSRLELMGDLYYLFSLLISKSIVEGKMVSNNKVNKKITYAEEAIDIIRKKYYKTDFLVKEVSEKLSLNQSYLTNIFREVTGKTLYEYLVWYRIQMSCTYLETTDLSISEIAEYVGYENPISFTRMFKKILNTTPSLFRKRGSLTNIEFNNYFAKKEY